MNSMTHESNGGGASKSSSPSAAVSTASGTAHASRVCDGLAPPTTCSDDTVPPGRFGCGSAAHAAPAPTLRIVTTSAPVTVERWQEQSPGRTSCDRESMRHIPCMHVPQCYAHLWRVDLKQTAADQAPHEQRLDVNLDFSGVHKAADRNLQHDSVAIRAVVQRVLKRALVFLRALRLAVAHQGSIATRTCGGTGASGESTSNAVRFGCAACGADPSAERRRIACSFRAASRASRSAASSRCWRSRASGPQVSSAPSLPAGLGCGRREAVV